MPERAPNFVYVVYIAASPDTVWNALIERDLTKAYWEHYNVSDWKQGSPWRHVRLDESGTVDLIGTVVEIDPPSRMVISSALNVELCWLRTCWIDRADMPRRSPTAPGLRSAMR